MEALESSIRKRKKKPLEGKYSEVLMIHEVLLSLLFGIAHQATGET